MKVHVPTKTLYRTDDQAYLGYRVLSGGKAEPIDSIIWADWDIYTYEQPTYDSATEKITNVIIENAGIYSKQVVPLTTQELADNIASQLESDLRQATLKTALVVIALAKAVIQQTSVSGGDFNIETQAAFAELTALVDQYTT